MLGLLVTVLAAVVVRGALAATAPPAPALAADTVAVAPSLAVPAAPARETPPPPPAPAPPTPAPTSSCGAAAPVVVAAGPLARVSVCDDAGRLTYRGTRTSDGASVVLPAARSGSSWTAGSGDVAYRLGDGELLITRGGAVLEVQRLDVWWERPG